MCKCVRVTESANPAWRRIKRLHHLRLYLCKKWKIIHLSLLLYSGLCKSTYTHQEHVSDLSREPGCVYSTAVWWFLNSNSTTWFDKGRIKRGKKGCMEGNWKGRKERDKRAKGRRQKEDWEIKDSPNYIRQSSATGVFYFPPIFREKEMTQAAAIQSDLLWFKCWVICMAERATWIIWGSHDSDLCTLRCWLTYSTAGFYFNIWEEGSGGKQPLFNNILLHIHTVLNIHQQELPVQSELQCITASFFSWLSSHIRPRPPFPPGINMQYRNLYLTWIRKNMNSCAMLHYVMSVKDLIQVIVI